MNEFKKHLTPLEKQGFIVIWSDIDINAGTEWEEEIKKHLKTAQIILYGGLKILVLSRNVWVNQETGTSITGY